MREQTKKTPQVHARRPGLLIPYAFDDAERLVAAGEAIRGQAYRCPECRSPVMPRAGTERVIRHFAHDASRACHGETVVHRTAKLLLVQIIEEAARPDGRRIMLENECPGCHERKPIELPARSFSAARCEARVGGFVCDVVGFRDAAAVLALEVLATHRVDERKAGELGLPFVELLARDVIAEPWIWRPRNAAGLQPCLCSDCRSWLRSGLDVCRRWRIDPARFPAYLPAEFTCYRCRERIPVFWWENAGHSKRAPPKPRPPTILWTKTLAWEAYYWANACPKCRGIQGDHFLHRWPDGEFWRDCDRLLGDFRRLSRRGGNRSR